ncbi:MAG TPA: helix-turn-helix domain-containing protein, partial [Ktedonobacterales bacterium]|nr:helix-turn-helix domain-containing protein [Ktedonobacterales bacterium]
PELVRHFVGKLAPRTNAQVVGLDEAAMARLFAYDWPGNVRELEHAMERAVVLAEGKPKIAETDLPPEIARPTSSAADDGELLPLAEIERWHILRVLERMAGNRKETARVLGIGTNTLWRKLGEYAAPPRRRARGR